MTFIRRQVGNHLHELVRRNPIRPRDIKRHILVGNTFATDCSCVKRTLDFALAGAVELDMRGYQFRMLLPVELGVENDDALFDIEATFWQRGRVTFTSSNIEVLSINRAVGV